MPTLGRKSVCVYDLPSAIASPFGREDNVSLPYVRV